jgi:hypothetical protein
MFTHSLKDLPIIKVEKEERKHEIQEEIKEHLHILIPNPPETYFHTLINFTKRIFFYTCIIGGYKSLLDLMLNIQGLRSQNTKFHG